jgi:hypothetical protein
MSISSGLVARDLYSFLPERGGQREGGLFLLALATRRAGVLPNGETRLWLAGILVAVVAGTLNVAQLPGLGLAAVGSGRIWLGRALRAGRR